MPDYQKLYLTLFNAVTDAIAVLEETESWSAGRALLIRAQQKCEDLYIESGTEIGNIP